MAALVFDFTLPLRDFELTLALEVGKTVALVGPSGAGKTSSLRVVAGLARPARGRVTLAISALLVLVSAALLVALKVALQWQPSKQTSRSRSALFGLS